MEGCKPVEHSLGSGQALIEGTRELMTAEQTVILC